MNIITLGINHQTAGIAVREKFFLTETEQSWILSELKATPFVLEAFVLSTCNRTEITVHLLKGSNGFSFLLGLLCRIKKQTLTSDVAGCFYGYHGEEAVRHLFRVAAGLDSLILGEKQILGQIKQAVAFARERGHFSRAFNILTQLAIRTGKKARTETGISFGGLSVSWAAFVKAEAMLGGLEDKSLLVMGAGKMSELALQQVKSKPVRRLMIMNRTRAHAEVLAGRFNAEAWGFCDILSVLDQTDVVICASGAPHYVIEHEILDRVMAGRSRPLILIDISVPRNIDPSASSILGIQLVHIDDLQGVVEETRRVREASVVLVEQIVESKVQAFWKKMTSPVVSRSSAETAAAGSSE